MFFATHMAKLQHRHIVGHGHLPVHVERHCNNTRGLILTFELVTAACAIMAIKAFALMHMSAITWSEC